MDKFNIGDLVKLKSGSPVMTVLEYPNEYLWYNSWNENDGNHLTCKWYNKMSNKFEIETFHESMLEICNEDEKTNN